MSSDLSGATSYGYGV